MPEQLILKKPEPVKEEKGTKIGLRVDSESTRMKMFDAATERRKLDITTPVGKVLGKDVALKFVVEEGKESFAAKFTPREEKKKEEVEFAKASIKTKIEIPGNTFIGGATVAEGDVLRVPLTEVSIPEYTHAEFKVMDIYKNNEGKGIVSVEVTLTNTIRSPPTTILLEEGKPFSQTIKIPSPGPGIPEMYMTITVELTGVDIKTKTFEVPTGKFSKPDLMHTLTTKERAGVGFVVALTPEASLELVGLLQKKVSESYKAPGIQEKEKGISLDYSLKYEAVANNMKGILARYPEKAEMIFVFNSKKLSDTNFRLSGERTHTNAKDLDLVKLGATVAVDSSILHKPKAKIRLGMEYRTIENTLTIKDAGEERKLEQIFTPRLEFNLSPSKSAEIYGAVSDGKIMAGMKLNKNAQLMFEKAVRGEDTWSVNTAYNF